MLERIFLKLCSFSDKYDLMNERLVRLTELTVAQSRDTFSIRQRQNMLFKKQDIIQSTLAGEVDVHTPCSLSTSPAVAWCPIPNSPPLFSPPISKIQVVSHPVVNKQQYYPTYATPLQSFDSRSAYSLDEVHSFISDKWEEEGSTAHPPSQSGRSVVGEQQPSSAQIGQAVSEIDTGTSYTGPVSDNMIAPPVTPAQKSQTSYAGPASDNTIAPPVTPAQKSQTATTSL